MTLRETLSKFWFNVQYTLIPGLEQDLGELTPLHKKLISILELVRIEEFISCTSFNMGRPRQDRSFIARAYVAKIVFKLSYTNQLIRLLKTDKVLRNICGFDSLRKIPSESKFSRVFAEFSLSTLPEKVHKNLIHEVYKGQTAGHVVKDSAPLEVREKHVKKISEKKSVLKKQRRQRIKLGELSRRQKQLIETDLNKSINKLPKVCDKGMKKSAEGYTKIWKGYKLHAAVDDHCIPLAVIITSASLNDCEVAIPLANKASQVANNYYDIMDAAYDHPEIKEHSISLGHIPIIDKCPAGKKQKKEKENEKRRRKLLNFQTAEDKRYKERFPKERFNAQYKDFNGGRHILFRGHSKVSCHVMFGVLTLAASTIIKLIQ